MLQKGKVNVLLDQFYGSSAKGQVITAIADKHRPEILMANHSTSASHTVIEGDVEFVFKALPTASILNKIRPGYKPLIVLSPSSGFELYQILKEIEYCGLAKEQVIIHPRAVVITEEHRLKEAGENGTLHLGSTMSGQSYAFSEKMTRQPNAKLAKDYTELQEVATIPSDESYFPELLASRLDKGETILFEMPQGFPLSIDHGPKFPYSTFRNITPTQAIADIGLNHNYLGSVIANIRSLPIRVSNRYIDNNIDNVSLRVTTAKGEDKWVTPAEIGMDYSDVNAITYDVNFLNKEREFSGYIIHKIAGVVGTSGPFEADMQEISWRQLSDELTAKAGKETKVKEITTLTKLNRRIARPVTGSISKEMLRKSKITLAPTHFSVTFLNYIDPTVEGATTEAEFAKSETLGKWLQDARADIEAVFGKNAPPISVLQAGKELKNVVIL